MKYREITRYKYELMETLTARVPIVAEAQTATMSETISGFMGLRNRGAKEGYWMGGEHPGTKPDAFVSQTSCPAFIPEPLFIDNDSEVAKWFLSGWHDQIAEAIDSAVTDAFGGV